ncbi:transposase domain-containing protein [Escherichia coli]|nr:transposase domain-containing protein [Escherichia coli]
MNVFFGSDYGSERTCCLNGIDPQAYLRHYNSSGSEYLTYRVMYWGDI